METLSDLERSTDLFGLHDSDDDAIVEWQRRSTAMDMNPIEWANQKEISLWSKQREIIQSVAVNRRTAVHSAHTTGKSFTASSCAAWWIDRYATYPGGAFVVTTAPTGSQVRAILWKELRRLHRKVGLQGRTNQTEWWIGDELVAFGRKPKDWEPEAFQGIHAARVLVIIDEASGVPSSIWESVESLISNEGSHVLAIGNPLHSHSKFSDICKPGTDWNVIHIDGLESPNFTDEGKDLPKQVRDSLLSRLWVDEKMKDWGKDSPIFIARVRGKFPPEDSDKKVIPWQLIENVRPYVGASLGEARSYYTSDDLLPVELGVDIGASTHGDETVIVERHGVLPVRITRFRSGDDNVIKGRIIKAARECDATSVKIDATGVGFGIVGSVRSGLNGKAKVHGVHVGKAPYDRSKFVRLRDEIWWMGRDLCNEKRWDLSLMDDKVIAELNGIFYEIDIQGRIKVEKKEDMKKRLGRSPDSADALLLSFIKPKVRRRKPRVRSSA